MTTVRVMGSRPPVKATATFKARQAAGATRLVLSLAIAASTSVKSVNCIVTHSQDRAKARAVHQRLQDVNVTASVSNLEIAARMPVKLAACARALREAPCPEIAQPTSQPKDVVRIP